MPGEPVYWHKGIAFHARSALMEAGHLATAQNVIFEVDGKTSLRPKFTAQNETAIGAIHSMKRFGDNLLVGDADELRYWDGAALNDLATGFASGARWDFSVIKDFLFGTNGTDQVLYDGADLYPAQIENPVSAPTATAGAAGTPNGHYMLYVSYLITFPNGNQYETGLSDASADVPVTNQKIEWADIPVCPYAELAGTAPTIHRKLYRGPGTGGSLADIYFVATIEDNTTTTYSDNFTDSELGAAGACEVTDYQPAPDSAYSAMGYGRLFLIDKDYPNRLWYAEPAGGETATENEILLPLAFPDDNWDDLRELGLEEIDPKGLVYWGMNLYIGLSYTWIRKQGNDPASWSYKRTWADHGVSAPDTIAICSSPIGILYLSLSEGGDCGLCLFNGQESTMFTSPRLDYIFKEHLDHTYIANCCGRLIGKYYHLLYPSVDATGGVPDTHIAFDLRRYPDIRVANWTALSGQCIEGNSLGEEFYIGGTDGIIRQWDRESEATVDAVIKSKDLIGGPQLANTRKTIKELKYNLDSGGDNIQLAIYIDGAVMKWPDDTTYQNISGTGDLVQVLRGFPQNASGYVFAIQLTGTGLDELAIYSPWELVFDPTP